MAIYMAIAADQSPLQVVPCTPNLKWNHSTPLSAQLSRRFYAASPTGDNTELVIERQENEPQTPNMITTPAWTPIPRLRSQSSLLQHFSNATPTQLRIPTPTWKLIGSKKAVLNISQSSVGQNQVVPRTPASDESSGGGKRTKLKHKFTKSIKLSDESSTSSNGSEGTHRKPYFTIDDEDIFSEDVLDVTTSNPEPRDVEDEDDDIFT